MELTRDQAWDHLCAWTETESLRKHARSVEIVMRAAAYRYGAGDDDIEAWGIAGMLHDAAEPVQTQSSNAAMSSFSLALR